MNAADDDPATDAIYATGTLASVLQLLKLPDGTVKVLVEGAARAKIARYTPDRRFLRGRGRGARRRPDRHGRGRGAGALGAVGVRELRQAQQEDLARGRRGGRRRSTTTQARRHDRLAPRGQARRQAGDPRDPLDRQALREVPGADGERDLGAAGREAHPHARQAPDGEDAARVLPQRADEGDPEGARRRGRQGRARPSSRSASRRPSSPRKRATRRWPS